jgi:hypothetical protein
MALVVRAPSTRKPAEKKFKEFTVSIKVEDESYAKELAGAIRGSDLDDGDEIAKFIETKAKQ